MVCLEYIILEISACELCMIATMSVKYGTIFLQQLLIYGDQKWISFFTM